MFYRFGGGERLGEGSQITYVSSVNGTPTKDIYKITDEDGSMTYTGGWNEPSPLIVAESVFVSLKIAGGRDLKCQLLPCPTFGPDIQ